MLHDEPGLDHVVPGCHIMAGLLYCSMATCGDEQELRMWVFEETAAPSCVHGRSVRQDAWH